MFVLRGGLFVLLMLSSEISHALRFIADPSKRLIDMITPPIANINIDAFSPPVEQGTVAVPRAPEVHFQTFVEVLVAVIQQGQAESKGGVSQGRRDLLIDEWQKMSKTLRAYMNTHYNTLLPRQQKVRERVIFAANRDIDDFFGLVFDATVPVKGAFPYSAPLEGDCGGINAQLLRCCASCFVEEFQSASKCPDLVAYQQGLNH